MADSKIQGSSGNSHIGAIVGWGTLTLATLGFIWLVVGQLAQGGAGREDEALEFVQKYKTPEMAYNLKDQTIEIGNAARANGAFIGVFDWERTYTDEGAIYMVTLTWKDNNKTRKAIWKVDVDAKTIEPSNADAKEFMQPVAVAPG